MSEAFYLYITGSLVHARRRAGFLWRAKTESVGDWRWNSNDPTSLNFAPLAKKEKQRTALHVYIGAALCRLAVVSVPAGVDDEKEQLAIARTHLRDQMGLDVTGWEFSIDPVRSPAKIMVCAIRKDVFHRITELAKEKGFLLVSVKPYVAGIWNIFEQNRKEKAAVSVLIAIEEDAFTSVVEQEGKFQVSGTLRHDGEAELIDREIRRIGLTFGEEVQKGTSIALAEQMLQLAKAHMGKVLSQAARKNGELPGDFSDKLVPLRKGT